MGFTTSVSDVAKIKPRSILARFKIVTGSDYRAWASKNHPDVGGNSELFKEVSGAWATINK